MLGAARRRPHATALPPLRGSILAFSELILPFRSLKIRQEMIAYRNRTVPCCLAVLGISWIVMGIIAPTNMGIYWVVRHVIQALPLFVAVIVLANRPSWISSICFPLFVVWLWVTFALWDLWIDEMRSIPHTVFPTHRAALACIIALTAALGLIAVGATSSNLRPARRLALGGSALAVQLAALFLGSLIH